MEERLVGIVPVRELDERARASNFESWPISSGIVPDRLFWVRYREVRFVDWKISMGIGPSK